MPVRNMQFIRRITLLAALAACAVLSTGALSLVGAQVEEQPAESEPAPAPPVVEPIPPLTGARAWLEGNDVDDSQFEKFIDGSPMDGGEREVMLTVMYWLGHLDLAVLERWTGSQWQPDELVQNTDDQRGELFFLTGTVTGLETLRPLPEAARRLDIQEYYRCRVVRADGQPAVVFARTVPRAWLEKPADGDEGQTQPPETQPTTQQPDTQPAETQPASIEGQEDRPADGPAEELSYRVSGRGVFLKLASDDPQRPTPVFVLTRLAWHPDTPLGNLGMDAGLLDEVEQRKELTKEDRECFYQMLAALGRAEPGQLLRQAGQTLQTAGKDKYSVVPLFNEAHRQHGRLVALRGVARRLVRIPVGDADVVERFGIDHYYEMALYTEESTVAIGGPAPLVFCLRDLPEGMPTGDGPDYAEEVYVAGFFMKTWAYRSQEADIEGKGPKAVQLAPLLIGRQPVWYPQEPAEPNTMAAAVAGGLFVLALLGIWIGLWRYGRGDREFHERTIAKVHAPDAGLSLNEIGLDARGKPDFRHLSEPGEGDEESRS